MALHTGGNFRILEEAQQMAEVVLVQKTPLMVEDRQARMERCQAQLTRVV
jgi:hypothetical protein